MKILINNDEFNILSCHENFRYGRFYEHRLICAVPFSTIETEKFINNDGFYIITDNDTFFYENFQLKEIVEEADHLAIIFIKID